MSQSHVQLLETQVNVQLFTTSSFFCLKRWILLCKAKRGKKSFLSKLISFDEIIQRCLCLSQTLNGLILWSAETVDTELPLMGWKWGAKGMETLRNPTEELGKISRDNYHILKILSKLWKSCRIPELYKELVKLLGQWEANASTILAGVLFFRFK